MHRKRYDTLILNVWKYTIIQDLIQFHEMVKCGRGGVSIAMNCPTQGKCIARNECAKHCCDAIDIVCRKCQISQGQISTKRTKLYRSSYLYLESKNERYFNFATISMQVMTNITAIARLPSNEW